MRPHGISHTSFLDYSRDLRQQVTTTFWGALQKEVILFYIFTY